MSRVSGRIAILILAAGALAGCAGAPAAYDPLPRMQTGAREAQAGPLQCVPYAREHSGIAIYGDAWTWWDRAAGKYPRHSFPLPGAVMVLQGYDGARSGHVAVVRSLVARREIRVDHANWLDDGAIYVDDPVADVSPGNDWSEVRVWNEKTQAWGGRIYPVQGFIGPAGNGGPAHARTDLIARTGGK